MNPRVSPTRMRFFGKSDVNTGLLPASDLAIGIVNQLLQSSSQLRRESIEPCCVDQADVEHV